MSRAAFLAPLLLGAWLAGSGVAAQPPDGARARLSADPAFSPAASVDADQVGAPVRATLAAEPELSPPAAQAAGAAEQVAPRTHADLASEQLARERRSASAPAELSSRREGHSLSMVVVHGHDRCDPLKGDAPREECAAILDYRADQFARPADPAPSAEQLLIDSPPETDLARDATAARRLGTPQGADPNVAAAAAAVEGGAAGAQAAALAAADHSAPAVPLSVVTTGGAPAGAAPAPK